MESSVPNSVELFPNPLITFLLEPIFSPSNSTVVLTLIGLDSRDDRSALISAMSDELFPPDIPFEANPGPANKSSF